MLIDEIKTLWLHLKKFGTEYTVSVFITPDRMIWCPAKGKTHKRLLAQHSEHEIGWYTRHIDLFALTADCLREARRVGLI